MGAATATVLAPRVLEKDKGRGGCAETNRVMSSGLLHGTLTVAAVYDFSGTGRARARSPPTIA